MAKITVDLEAFYGFGCGFQSYGSNQTIEMEVSEKELEFLRKFGKDIITANDIVATIESGDTTLESLHEQLSDKFYYMVEEYWIYEANNECLYECLECSLKEDIENGLYPPTSSNDNDDEEDDDYDEEEDDYYGYDDDEEDIYDLDVYFNWLKTQSHEFAAKRVGLDIDTCQDDEVYYTIKLDK